MVPWHREQQLLLPITPRYLQRQSSHTQGAMRHTQGSCGGRGEGKKKMGEAGTVVNLIYNPCLLLLLLLQKGCGMLRGVS